MYGSGAYTQNFEVLRGTSLTNRSIKNDANILINQARQRSRACMLSSSSDTRQPVCAAVGCRRSRRECSHCYYRYCLLCPETTSRVEIDGPTRARGRRERKATTAPLPHLFQGVEVLQRRFTTSRQRCSYWCLSFISAAGVVGANEATCTIKV